MAKRSKAAAFGAVVVLTTTCLAAVVTAGPATSARAQACSFQLRIGDVPPFTGDLAAYGANLDRGVKLAVDLQQKALASAGLGGSASVTLVASEDGQTSASASVEAADRLLDRRLVHVETDKRDQAAAGALSKLERAVVGSAKRRLTVGLVHAEHECPCDPVGAHDPLEFLVLAREAVDVMPQMDMGVEDLGVHGQEAPKLVVVVRKKLIRARERLDH